MIAVAALARMYAIVGAKMRRRLIVFALRVGHSIVLYGNRNDTVQ